MFFTFTWLKVSTAASKSTFQSCSGKSSRVSKEQIYTIDLGTPVKALFKHLTCSLQHFHQQRSPILNNSAAKVTALLPPSALEHREFVVTSSPSPLHSTTVISLWSCSKNGYAEECENWALKRPFTKKYRQRHFQHCQWKESGGFPISKYLCINGQSRFSQITLLCRSALLIQGVLPRIEPISPWITARPIMAALSIKMPLTDHIHQ